MMTRFSIFVTAAVLFVSLGTQASGQNLLNPLQSQAKEASGDKPPQHPPAEEQLVWAREQALSAAKTAENFDRSAFERLLQEAGLPAEAAEEMESSLTSIARNYTSAATTLEKVISSQEHLKGASDQPPTPVDAAAVEALRSQAAELRNQSSGLTAQIELDQIFLAQQRQALAESKRTLRRAIEDMDAAPSSKKSSTALLVQLAQAKTDANSSSVFLHAWRLYLDNLELKRTDLLRQEIENALAASGLDTLFNKARAEAALESISEVRIKIEDALKNAKEEADRMASRVATLTDASEEKNSGGSIETPALHDAREASNLADHTVRGYELWLAGLKVKEECWQAILASLENPVATAPLVEAREMADRIINGLKPWSEHQAKESQDLSSRLAQLERLPPPANSTEAETQNILLEAAKTRDQQLRQLAHEGENVLLLASSLAKESRQRLTERSLQARLAGTWEKTKSFASTIWETEVFTADEKVMTPDGSSVVRERSVTLGMLTLAIAGAVAAVFVARWLAARIGRNLRRRLGEGFTKIQFIERGLFVVLVSVIVLSTLSWLHIPLTAFAFLGGAIAIGIGFGTQAVMNNFISGLILTAERRIRVGDIIEVDGITGSVVGLGTRCSSVQKFDGVEVLVPNSLLLERSVANWTLSNSHHRFDFMVGVAYGSNTRTVLALLEKCLADQKEILTERPPVVAFEAFGESTLDFHLYYWLDIRASNGLKVGTELRLHIDEQCRKAGIEIAFPQRDIHLQSDRPLRVQLEGKNPNPSE